MMEFGLVLDSLMHYGKVWLVVQATITSLIWAWNVEDDFVETILCITNNSIISHLFKKKLIVKENIQLSIRIRQKLINKKK